MNLQEDAQLVSDSIYALSRRSRSMADPTSATLTTEEIGLHPFHSSVATAIPLESPQPSAKVLPLHYFVDLAQTSPDAQTALLKLTQALGEWFEADSYVGLLDNHFNIIQSTHAPHGFPSKFQPPQELSALLNSLSLTPRPNTLEPITITDVQALSHCHFNSNLGIRAILVIQTIFQGRPNGIILLTRSQPYEWTESDMYSLKTLSTCVAVSISQMQLEQHAQQQIHYQVLLDQLAIASHSACDLDRIFELALSGTVNAMQASRGFVLLLKYSEPLLKNRSLDPLVKPKIPHARVIVECQYPLTCDSLRQATDLEQSGRNDSFAGTWLKTAFPIAEHEISQCISISGADSDFVSISRLPAQTQVERQEMSPPKIAASSLAPLLNLEAMPSLLLMPLESQGRILGCLILQHEQQRGWQPQEIGFVKLVAAQVSIAMIQAQTLRQVQSLVDERTAQLRKSLDVQAKLYEKTRQQVDQLRRLNQVMEEFVSTMSHELRTPLTSMTLAIRMLRQANLSPEQRTKYLDILERQCLQETNLVNDLLALQKMESGSETSQFQLLDVRYVIQDIVHSLDQAWTKKQMKLEVQLPDRPLCLRTDPDSLSRILSELLTNAEKYGAFGSTIHLQVTYQAASAGDRIQLTLSNMGAGITSEEMPYIFDKFRRGRGVTQQAIPGTGLGLALVKGLVEHLGGAIAVSSTPFEQSSLWETCFTLTLPQSPDSPIV